MNVQTLAGIARLLAMLALVGAAVIVAGVLVDQLKHTAINH